MILEAHSRVRVKLKGSKKGDISGYWDSIC